MQNKTIENQKPQLMSYEEYSKGSPHKAPHYYVLDYDPNKLFYFGEEHSSDPNHKQWQEHAIFWNQFLNETKDHKRICFIEGGLRPVARERDEAILKYGGMGLVIYLANISQIEVLSPEPEEKSEREYLEKTFSRELIQYYYFVRVAHQWSRKKHRANSFEDYIKPYLDRDRRESGWGDFNFSVANMRDVHKRLFNREFDPEESEFLQTHINPTVINSDVSNVARSCSRYRDLHIVAQIENYLKLGYSIFIQYGNTHAYMQEPYLRSLRT
jgi:hypothetical protein